MAQDRGGTAHDDVMLRQLLAIKERRRDRARHLLGEIKKQQQHAERELGQQAGELNAMRAHNAGRIAELRTIVNSQLATGASHVALHSQEALFRKEEDAKRGEVHNAAAYLREAEQATAKANAAFLNEVKAVEKLKELRRLAGFGKAP